MFLDDLAVPAPDPNEGRAVIAQRPPVREVQDLQDGGDPLERAARGDDHLRTRGGQAVDALQDTLGRTGGCQDRAVDIEGNEDLGDVSGKAGGQRGLGLVAQDREGPRGLPGGGNRQEALMGHHATGTRTSSPPR